MKLHFMKFLKLCQFEFITYSFNFQMDNQDQLVGVVPPTPHCIVVVGPGINKCCPDYSGYFPL